MSSPLRRRRGSILILIAAFILIQSCGGAGGEQISDQAGGGAGGEQSSDKVRAALVGWQERFNARDSEAVCDLFAPDLVAVFQGQPERNFSQLCRLLQSSVSDTSRRYHYDLDIRDVFVSGPLGAVRLVWTLTVTDNTGTVIDTSIEPGIDIFHRQSDGRWKIARFISFSETPSS